MPNSVPEWVESQGKPINGLDLTGLRLPVDAISSYQLIGITTVTPRVRFLTIRAWIVKAYGESGLTNTYKTFEEFALRVEAAIIFALLLDNRNLLHLPGVTKALTIIDELQDPIILERLVDQPGFNLYAGTTYNLLLGFGDDNGLPGLTQERGIPLAEVFEGLINNTCFFRDLKANPNIRSVSRADLVEFGQSIRLEEISPNERDVLLSALLPLQPAEKWVGREVRRVGTYSLLLELANHHQRLPKEDDVFTAALVADSRLPQQLTPVLDGYLCYRVRDALAVVHEAVLGLVCRELGAHEGSVPHDKIINAVVSDIMSNVALRNLGILTNDETIDTIRFQTLVERVDELLGNKTPARGVVRWQGNLDENAIIKSVMQNRDMAAGLMPVVWLLCRHRVAVMDSDAFPHLRMLLQAGAGRLELREVIFPQLESWTAENPFLVDVISWLVQRTVDQHLRIAWSRMFADMDKDVAILLSDGDLWQYREKNYVGGRMASRIPDAIGWLDQLQLVEQGGLTEPGQKVLQHGYEVLMRCGGEA
jgi:hypothetical protein